MENILRELEPLVEQGRVEGFFNNASNVGKLDGLVEDIRDATMDCWVCIHEPFITDTPDGRTRFHRNKISPTRVASSS